MSAAVHKSISMFEGLDEAILFRLLERKQCSVYLKKKVVAPDNRQFEELRNTLPAVDLEIMSLNYYLCSSSVYKMARNKGHSLAFTFFLLWSTAGLLSSQRDHSFYAVIKDGLKLLVCLSARSTPSPLYHLAEAILLRTTRGILPLCSSPHFFLKFALFNDASLVCLSQQNSKRITLSFKKDRSRDKK